MLKVRVIVTHLPPCHHTELCPSDIVADYVMDHDDQTQRKVMGEQCGNALRAGQTVTTFWVA